MKNTLFLLFVAIALFTFGCDNDELKIESLDGIWVESSNLSDTLIFNTNEFEGWLYLNRGKELQNDYLLPKIGSGSYDYEIIADSIKLQYHLSSCMCPKSYEFKILSDEDKLRIGNFFDDSIPFGEPMVFVKI